MPETQNGAETPETSAVNAGEPAPEQAETKPKKVKKPTTLWVRPEPSARGRTLAYGIAWLAAAMVLGAFSGAVYGSESIQGSNNTASILGAVMAAGVAFVGLVRIIPALSGAFERMEAEGRASVCNILAVLLSAAAAAAPYLIALAL